MDTGATMTDYEKKMLALLASSLSNRDEALVMKALDTIAALELQLLKKQSESNVDTLLVINYQSCIEALDDAWWRYSSNRTKGHLEEVRYCQKRYRELNSHAKKPSQ